MTQKQTDYDKALKGVIDYVSANNTPDMRLNTTKDIIEYAFYHGYEYGKLSLNASKSMPLDHFRDSTKMMRYEIAMRAMQQLMPLGVEEYHQPDKVAELSVTYANYLIKELGKEE